MSEEVKTKSEGIMKIESSFMDNGVSIDDINNKIEEVKKQYPHYKWISFHIQNVGMMFFSDVYVMGVRELTEEEKATEERREKYFELKNEFEPVVKDKS